MNEQHPQLDFLERYLTMPYRQIVPGNHATYGTKKNLYRGHNLDL